MNFRPLAFRVVQSLGVGPLLRLLLKNCALRDNGWFRSARLMSAVDASGDPIPWMTYGAINFLSERLNSRQSLFEYGAGNSSIWFSQRVGIFKAVEHTQKWADVIALRIAPNGEVVTREVGPVDYGEVAFASTTHRNSYTDAILETETRYDVIVVDGIYRNACIGVALHRLVEHGVMILDNTDYPEFEAGMRILSDAGFRAIHFPGMAPITQRECQTSIYYRSRNCLNI